MLLGLDHHQRAGFTEYEAVTVPVERAAGASRVFVIGGHHDAHLGERRDRHRFDLGLDTTADRDVGLAEHDVPPRLGDAFGT